MSKLSLPGREAWGHPFGVIEPPVTTGLIGAWRFGKPSGMSDAQARLACTPNKAPGRGLSGPQSAALIGTPDVYADYWDFNGGANWLTSGLKNPQIAELDQFCIIAVAKTDEATINAAANRGFVAGWYGGNSGYGSGMVFTALTTLQGVTYEDSPITAKTANVSTSGAPQNVSKWRCYSVSRFGSSLVTQNITADGTTNKVTTPIGTRKVGERALTIGSAWNTYNAGAGVQIHAVLVYDLSGSGADISDADKVLIRNFLRTGVAGTALANTF